MVINNDTTSLTISTFNVSIHNVQVKYCAPFRSKNYFHLMPRIFLRKKITTPIAEGFPWIFDGDIGEIEGVLSSEEIVPVFTHNGSFVGKGFYSPHSKIKVRLISRQRDEVIDAAWWQRKIKACWQLRQKMTLTENCRLVFGEGDGLPGLLIDKLGDYFIVQSLTAGIDAQLPFITEALQKIFTPKGISLRNDAASRAAEGLTLTTGFLSESFDTMIPLKISGHTFYADLAQGPPPNFFCDTRLAETAFLPLIKGAHILSPYCRTGIFETQLLLQGAASIIAMPGAEKFQSVAHKNAAENGVAANISFHTGNPFDVLKQGVQEGKKYDAIFLNPNNFTKNKASLPQARNAWRELNLRAMQQLRNGGFLATTVRSYFIQSAEFIQLLQECARDAGRRLRILQTGGLPNDFPRLPYLPQGDYLKYMLAVIE